jgi:hypothetical protein
MLYQKTNKDVSDLASINLRKVRYVMYRLYHVQGAYFNS